MLATRFSTSFGWHLPHTDCGALLVRIYPQQGIGEPFNLGQETIDVGRETAKMLLADDSVSRQHASISWNGQSHVVSDLGSTNGTFVND
ncbi:MAG: FHA domain-containing protein, partial [Pirellulaceae bacterium]|nr:FHA domain-containing protein [Pirellulaceae bacterium]